MSYEVRYVEWLDSSADSGWQSLSELTKHEIDACVSVGFVLSETDAQVLLIQSHTERTRPDVLQSGQAALAIPKFAITKSVTIKEAD